MTEFSCGREEAIRRMNKFVLRFFNKPLNIELITQAATVNSLRSFDAVYESLDKDILKSSIWNSAYSERENYVLDLIYSMLQDFIRHYAQTIKVLHLQLDTSISSSASSEHIEFFDYSSVCSVSNIIQTLWMSKKTQHSLIKIFKLNYKRIKTKKEEYHIKEDIQCVICHEMIYDHIKDFEILRCNHVFHNCCIEQWRKRSENCPCCRQHM